VGKKPAGSFFSGPAAKGSKDDGRGAALSFLQTGILDDEISWYLYSVHSLRLFRIVIGIKVLCISGVFT